MSKVLVLTSSVLGEASVSNQLVAEAVAQLRLQDPGAEIVTRDLVGSPVPHLTPNSAAALRGGEPANAEQAAAIKLSDELIGELKAADIIVIGAPMYNFGIASSLKAWFDYALRAGVTFRYSEAGPEGLVLGKRAIIIETRGGFYSEGAMQSFDSQEPHLRNLLGFIGITDVTFVKAEKLAFGPQAREQAIKAARVHIGQTVQDQLFQAA
ncbi:NAD(P)H-dependent oxidoreductase (plasmid) [Phyllobacteriaceae bacterium JZ32]